jgi:hypothetical protein
MDEEIDVFGGESALEENVLQLPQPLTASADRRALRSQEHASSGRKFAAVLTTKDVSLNYRVAVGDRLVARSDPRSRGQSDAACHLDNVTATVVGPVLPESVDGVDGVALVRLGAGQTKNLRQRPAATVSLGVVGDALIQSGQLSRSERSFQTPGRLVTTRRGLPGDGRGKVELSGIGLVEVGVEPAAR